MAEGFDQETFLINSLAICDGLMAECARAHPSGRTPQKNAKVVFETIGVERYEMITAGLEYCRCCRRHKRGSLWGGNLSLVQVEAMVPRDSPNCDCMCNVYGAWLESLKPFMIDLECPPPPYYWLT